MSSSISFSCSLKERSFFKRDSSLKDFTIKTAFEGLPAPHGVFEFFSADDGRKHFQMFAYLNENGAYNTQTNLLKNKACSLKALAG